MVVIGVVVGEATTMVDLEVEGESEGDPPPLAEMAEVGSGGAKVTITGNWDCCW